MLQDMSLLRIPGPSPIPPSVQRAMSQPMVGHRDPETKDLLMTIKPRLKAIFGTKEDVMVITGSGTSGLEAAVVNTAKRGSEVLVIVSGAFGDRFASICEAYDMVVHRLDISWGEAVDLDEVKKLLQDNPNIEVVFATFCETSTGILNPIPEISNTVHEHSDALVVVDGVSCVGGVKTEMDAWDVDIMVTGSQKAMMLPPGLTLIAASERAWKVIEQNDQNRFYLDLRTYRKSLADDSTPFTPGVSLLFGLNQALTLLEQEGLEEVYRRHEIMKQMTRAAMKALHIPLLTSDAFASPTVTAIKPNTFDPEALRKLVKKEFGLALAGGQKQLKGKIFRIGHMGYCTPADVLQIISILEIGLVKLGQHIMLGQGVAAAQQIYIEMTKQED